MLFKNTVCGPKNYVKKELICINIYHRNYKGMMHIGSNSIAANMQCQTLSDTPPCSQV